MTNVPRPVGEVPVGRLRPASAQFTVCQDRTRAVDEQIFDNKAEGTIRRYSTC